MTECERQAKITDFGLEWKRPLMHDDDGMREAGQDN